MFGPSAKRSAGGTPKTNARKIRKHVTDANQDNLEFETIDQQTLERKYPSALNFYFHPPGYAIRLETMEILAMERLRFLRTMEKYSNMKKDTEWIDAVKKDLNSSGLSAYYNLVERINTDWLQNRARDYISHFVLRLAYSRTDDLRRWFVSQEVDAFRFRCMLYPDTLRQMTEDYNLGYQQASPEEILKFTPQLLATYNSTYKKLPANEEEMSKKEFFKVRFTEALDLVRGRKVFLRGGECYVPISDLQHLLVFKFKSLLTLNVANLAKILPNLDEDERLVKMLSELDKRYTGADYSDNTNMDSIKPEQIKPLKEKGAFPMCMRSMQNALEKTHHLKYKARMQYGLFLKGIGLSMDDAIRYFRGEFTQSHIDADKFDKEYTYGIRYNYGKEGKKVNWAPWNCMRVIMESVGPGENHGCPYRHSDPENLRQTLVQSGLGGDGLNQVMTLSKEGHFQKACALQFKLAHKGQELSTHMTEHPNQFYQESVHGGPKAGTTSNNKARAQLETEKVNLY